MTSESAYSTGSSYLNVAVPTQDIAEDNLLIVNVDTGLHCVAPRERLPVLDSVISNESQLQVLPQRTIITVNTMALMGQHRTWISSRSYKGYEPKSKSK